MGFQDSYKNWEYWIQIDRIYTKTIPLLILSTNGFMPEKDQLFSDVVVCCSGVRTLFLV